ncbi:MAG: hypothetical protein OIF48_02180, partial [Silicimonas sp.]|nr:hypothetical protein [Silicimonas sp.]
RIKTCCQRLAEGQAHFKPVRLVDREVFLSHCASHLLFFETGDPVVIPAVLHGRMDVLRRVQQRI